MYSVDISQYRHQVDKPKYYLGALYVKISMAWVILMQNLKQALKAMLI